MPTAGNRTTALKDLALSIVRAQSNVYVKELLRDRGIPIGATKEDFDRNLSLAIDQGTLTREHLESWLAEVEGWGQQHVYVYRLTANHVRAFKDPDVAEQRVRAARLGTHWRKSTASPSQLRFPDSEKLRIVSITYGDSLRFHWHKGTKYWIRSKKEETHDKPPEWIDGFEYEFRAYRGRSIREVMRFEIRPSDRLAALFIPKPIRSEAHQQAYEQAKRTIDRVLDFSALEERKLLIGDIIKNLDQRAIFDENAVAGIASHSTRLRSGAASVEFAALASGGSYTDSAGVRQLRESLRTDDDIEAFEGTTGTFHFGPNLGRVQLFANDNRIRLWSSLTADGVWSIVRLLAKNQQ